MKQTANPHSDHFNLLEFCWVWVSCDTASPCLLVSLSAEAQWHAWSLPPDRFIIQYSTPFACMLSMSWVLDVPKVIVYKCVEVGTRFKVSSKSNHDWFRTKCPSAVPERHDPCRTCDHHTFDTYTAKIILNIRERQQCQETAKKSLQALRQYFWIKVWSKCEAMMLLSSLNQELLVVVPSWGPCEAKQRKMLLARPFCKVATSNSI